MKPQDRVIAIAPPAGGAESAPIRQPAGYSYAEAGQFIEFCVELDNQDDRLRDPDRKSPQVWPSIDAASWDPQPLVDSRRMVVRDLLEYRQGKGESSLAPWGKLFDNTLARVGKQPAARWDFDTVVRDARFNGFGPYQNAWLLYKGVGRNAGAYAIAIRGTVFSAAPSALEDFIFQPVQAKEFLSPHVRFARIKSASIHSGFAHGAFSLLLDDRYGIVRQLADLTIPAGSRLYIVGHSQGAALATLVHAFLHYASQAGGGDDIFSLRRREFAFKSYAFAQPKPGNQDFAADFACHTQEHDSALVINNNLDPVPQVPLTLQSLGDVVSDLPNQSLLMKVLERGASISNGLVRLVGRITEPMVRKDAAGYGRYFRWSQLGLNGGRETPDGSLNFTSAGHVYNVYGTPGNPDDTFLQHHASTYRQLLQCQLNF